MGAAENVLHRYMIIVYEEKMKCVCQHKKQYQHKNVSLN